MKFGDRQARRTMDPLLRFLRTLSIGTRAAPVLAALSIAMSSGRAQNDPDIRYLGNFRHPPEAYGQLGQGLAVGDVDGDGFSEVALGAPRVAPRRNPNTGWGRVFVLDAPSLRLTQVFDKHKEHEGHPLFSDDFGLCLGMADLDADGFDDLMIEYLWILRGAVTQVRYGPDLERVQELETPASSTASYHAFAVADFDRDGHPNLAVCKPLLAGAEVYGRLPFETSPAFEVKPDPTIGPAVIAAGDFNGDGAPDLAFGYPFESPGFKSKVGRVRIAWGPTFDEIKVIDHPFLDQPDIELSSFGLHLTGLDLDRDGVDDLAVGTRGRPCDPVWCSEFFVYHGPTLDLHTRITVPPELAYGSFGEWIEPLDGFAEETPHLAVGAPFSHYRGVAAAGSFCVVDRLAHDEAIKWPLYKDPTPQFEGLFGRRIAAGDVTGDGQDDVIVSAHRAFKDDRLVCCNGEAWFYDFSTIDPWRSYGQAFPKGNPPALLGEGTMQIGRPIELEVTGLPQSSLALIFCAVTQDVRRLVPGYGGPPYLLVGDPWWVLPVSLDEQTHGARITMDLPSGLLSPGDRFCLQALFDAPLFDPPLAHSPGLIATVQPDG